MRKSILLAMNLSLLLGTLTWSTRAAVGPTVPSGNKVSAPAPKIVSSVERVPASAALDSTVSDSPDLRVQEAARNWPPAQPPRWRPVLPALDVPQAVVEYDLRKRREITKPAHEVTGASHDSQTGPSEGSFPTLLGPESVLGSDDRVRVGDTTAYPWRTLCKLFITAADGSGWIGSGAIIGRADGNGFHVLTAGHCAYMHDRGGWVSSIEVIPGYDDGYMPFNRAYATYMRSYTGWTSSANSEHDWAVLTLDRRVGNFTGWLGRITRSSSHGIYTTTLNSSGYPGDLCGGNCLYYDSDLGRTANENRHWYSMDTAGGQSGMPVWLYTTAGTDPAPGRYITTVHAYGDDGSGNSGTRLNSDKFDRINSWIDSDTIPTDRPDLIDDGQNFSSFGPASVTSGATYFNVQCRVRNTGTASTGNFKVRFYASANSTINGSDYLIAESIQSGLAPFSYRTVSWSGNFPTGIPAGTYYIGWVIDAEGVVGEFDESNNTAYKPSPRLTLSNPSIPDIRITPTSLNIAGNAAVSGQAAPSAKAPAAVAAGGTPVLPGGKLIDGAQIMQDFVKHPKVRVIVNLVPPPGAQAAVNFYSPPDMKAWHTTVAGLQKKMMDALPPKDATIRYQFKNLAAFSAEVSWDGLQALMANPAVASVEPVYLLEPHLAQGIPLIGGMTHRSQYNGTGVAIAICDTGVDYNHPRLGGGGFPNSKILGGYDFGDGDSDPAPNGNGHGTACAGIAAGELGTVGDYIGGVAPGAKIYALKISSSGSSSATSDAMVAAWDWCVTHKNDDPNYPILAISTSFGGGRYSSACDAAVPSMTAAVNNAIAAGITVLASSGNNGYCDSLSWPACISGVISVGAVYDGGFGSYLPCVDAASCATKVSSSGCQSGYYADDLTAPDKVTSYCNAAPFLSILAPGNRCYTLDISSGYGYSSGDYTETFGGTSAACPYAAGAVASLQSAALARTGRFLTAAEIRAKLVSTGDNITDTKTPLTKPRVNLGRAIDSLQSGGQTFRIANDGNGTLTVHSISPETGAPWISVTPTGPFHVPAGGFQDVTVTVNPSLAPAVSTTTRLLVLSNDPDESPYPGAVYINVSPAGPANDHFANRSVVLDASAVRTGSNVGATKEPGEANHGGNTGGNSVWWSWTAPAPGLVRITTAGSSFDTLLGVYRGASLAGLSLIADNDDSDEGLTSAVTFMAAAGETYQIAVDGYNAQSGSIQLNLSPMAPLRLLPPQYVNGTWRILIASTDGRPLDLARAARIEVEASGQLSTRYPGWTRLQQPFSTYNGMLMVEDPAAAGQPVRFYRALERP